MREKEAARRNFTLPLLQLTTHKSYLGKTSTRYYIILSDATNEPIKNFHFLVGNISISMKL